MGKFVRDFVVMALTCLAQKCFCGPLDQIALSSLWRVSNSSILDNFTLDVTKSQDLAKIPIFGFHVKISNEGVREIRKVIRGDETE